MFALWATLVVAAIALVTDLRARRIPNWLTLPALPLLFVLHLHQPWLALAAAVVAAFPFAVVYWRGGLGGGDVKLAAAIGMGLGDLDPVITWLLATTVLGVVHAVVVAARRGRLGDTFRRAFTRRVMAESEPLTIPYAPAMFGGVVAIVLKVVLAS